MLDFLTDMGWALSLRSDALSLFFRAVTDLGGTWFAVLFLPLGYLLWRKDLFGRLIVLSLLSKILNAHLKAAYMLPRPDPMYHLIQAGESSFPSGHAQHATAMWMWLAGELGTPLAWIVSSVITGAVGLSRVYLGVHYARDVVGGFLVGAAMLLFFRWLVRRQDGPERRLFLAAQVGILFAIQGFWWAALPSGPYTFLPAALFLGFWGGLAIARRFAVHRRLRRSWRILTIAAIGVFGAIPIFTGGTYWIGPLGLGIHPASVYLQFGLLGAWGSLVAPGFKKSPGRPGPMVT